MNNKEFIAELSQRLDMQTSDTQKVVNALVDAMGDGFLEGNDIMLSSFGSFELKKKLERVIVNPATQQRMLVPPKIVLGFKPNNAWKEKLKKGGK